MDAVSVSREAFLREYLTAAAAANNQRSDRRWWATDIASKNRFASPLPRLLSQLPVRTRNPFWRIGLVWVRRAGSVFLEALRVSFRIGLVRWKLRGRIRALQRSRGQWYVLKTFVYEHSFGNERMYRDLMFGALLPELKRNNIQTLVLANIQGKYRPCLARFSSVDEMLLPLEAFVNFGDVWRAAADVFSPLDDVKGPVLFFGQDVAGLVNQALRETVHGIAFYQVLHYYAAKRLLQTVPISTLLLTSENNPWERMMIWAVRKHGSRPRIIGYQHAAVAQAQANLFVSNDEFHRGVLPDLVLTLGDVTKEILERYGSYPHGRLNVSCGLQFALPALLPRRSTQKRQSVLVVLEGVRDAAALVQFVFHGLDNHPEFSLRWRTHPALPWEKLVVLLPERIKPFFLDVSRNRTLTQDIEQADVVVYWGSTAALEAVAMGRPVVHCDLGTPLSFDPLEQCPGLHWSAEDPATLPQILKNILALPDEEFYGRRELARAYSGRYILPVTKERMRKFL